MFLTSKHIVSIIGLFWIGVILIACTQIAGEATPTAQPVILTPSTTPTTSLTSTITPDPQIISPANADQIVPLNYLNKGGAIGAPLYSPDGKWLCQASTGGWRKTIGQFFRSGAK